MEKSMSQKRGEAMKNAAIYCRVSTDNQESEGTSLQTQLEACLKYCQDKGYDVAYRFSEAYSGLTLERPKLNELRELIRSGDIDVVVVYCLDRLSRDPTHGVILTQELEKYSVILEAVTETVDSSELGKLISYIRGFASKLEAEKIRERTIRGKMERVKSGRLPGGRFVKLYGYDYVRGKGTGEGVRYINKAESEIVKEIYRLLVEDGYSLNKIAQRLNTLGIPSPSGKIWNRTGVYNILTNLAYTGKTYLFTRYKTEAQRHLKPSRKNKLTHNAWRPREEWIELKNATPQIVSEDIFNQVQLKLKRNKELASRNARRQYLLSGYVFCESCGRRFTAHSNGRNSYYSCPVCRDRRLNNKYLETAVWEKIEQLISTPEMVMSGVEMLRREANNDETYHKELERIEARLRHMKKEKDRAWKGFEITGDEEKFTHEIKNIMSTMDELEKQKAELLNRIETAEQAETNIKTIKDYCDLVRHNLGNLSFMEKREALEALRIGVIVGKDSINIQGCIPVVSSLSG
jgi:site-specific DNA recombinase